MLSVFPIPFVVVFEGLTSSVVPIQEFLASLF